MTGIESSAEVKVDDVNDPPRWVIGTVVVPFSEGVADRLAEALEGVRQEHG